MSPTPTWSRGIVLLLVASCGGQGGAPPPDPSTTPPTGPTTGAAALTATARVDLATLLPSKGVVLGARKLTVEASAPVSVTLSLDGDGTQRTIVFEELAASQELPILGMRLGSDYTVTVTATDGEGRSAILDPITIPGDPLPADWPVIDVLAHDKARAWPGWIQVDTKHDFANSHLVYLDPDLQPTTVWSYLYDVQDTDLVGDGTLLTRTDANGWLIDLLGNVIYQWGYEELDAEHYLPTDTEEYHHEIVPMGSRFGVLSSRTVRVDAYPRDYADPTVLGPPADLRDPSFAIIDMATGATESQWFMTDYLDPTRISFDSLNIMRGPDAQGDTYDWAHANAAAIDADGGYLVALRHQDVILKLDATGALVWMLGDPAGWGANWQPFLLTPVGDTTWPYHAHGISVDPATGVVQMLDNGNNGYTPYVEPMDIPQITRAVGYRVDPVAMTVEQVWAFQESTTGTLFSNSQGNAKILPNGNVFADYGAVLKEDGTLNPANGWGELSARIVEWAPDAPDAPVLDCRVRSDALTNDHGWTTYRATKIASLYPTVGPWRATETWLAP